MWYTKKIKENNIDINEQDEGRKMKQIRNILIGGERQAGKTYLVKRLIDELSADNNIKGYYTLADKADENTGVFKIYMYPANENIENRKKTNENCIGSSDGKERKINKETFEKLGVSLLSNIGKDDIVVMDEVGFFESEVKPFTSKVCETIESENYVIATIKEKYDNEYINKVRNYKDREDAIFVHVTPDNREEVFAELEKIVKTW